MCPDAACMERALKKKQLERALEAAITPETIERLKEELERVV
jgi:predicted RNA-binding protein YlxR (DUF448 family)